ncbi:TY-Chap domain-containing protein [Pseudoclavibacter terrae]|uniref:TY-Chap N-terminal domain-containing protein n=1 Tax=Pseudoclavibacter terrae TaxID=1530195 RepID=A0A7J5B3B4_9MICO|nr:hypothetical protein [Pseudoclavibacter terrae]KAB1638502.1 hypothetical protein F8O03_08955 [Pseudoclavibacter terrae]
MMNHTASNLVPGPGLYATHDGVVYPLRVHDGRWAFRSTSPVRGFVVDREVFIRPIAIDDEVECFSFEHAGVYRGLPVDVAPLPGGAELLLISTDRSSVELGFAAEQLRRGGLDWRKTVSNPDPDLDVTSTRVRKPAPWEGHPEEVLPPRARSRSGGRVSPGKQDGTAQLPPASPQLRAPGLYAVLDGVEYPVVRRDSGWALASPEPRSGFAPQQGEQLRTIGPEDPLEYVTINHSGTYRGLSVQVRPASAHTVQLSTRDRRSLDSGFLQFGFERPEIQEYVRSVELDDVDLQVATTREASAPPWLRNGQARLEPGVATTWSDFAGALASACEAVTDRVFLVVSGVGDARRYVQFAGGPTVLDAEAPGRDVVAAADERALRDAGWTPPRPGQPNWSTSARRRDERRALQALAEMSVAALRDGYSVGSPRLLTYTAWRDPQVFPDGASYTAEEWEARDLGTAAFEIPALRLPRR